LIKFSLFWLSLSDDSIFNTHRPSKEVYILKHNAAFYLHALFESTSKTASSPPSSLNFSLKSPPVFLTAPVVSKSMQSQIKTNEHSEKKKRKEKSFD
jgi:hypothetical protein